MDTMICEGIYCKKGITYLFIFILFTLNVS